jgi:hypothetical protein
MAKATVPIQVRYPVEVHKELTEYLRKTKEVQNTTIVNATVEYIRKNK